MKQYKAGQILTLGGRIWRVQHNPVPSKDRCALCQACVPVKSKLYGTSDYVSWKCMAFKGYSECLAKMPDNSNLKFIK